MKKNGRISDSENKTIDFRHSTEEERKCLGVHRGEGLELVGGTGACWYVQNNFKRVKQNPLPILKKSGV